MNSKKCCACCTYFEGRTGFCRVNPPNAVVYYIGQNICTEGKFPKIAYPSSDWCGCFQSKEIAQEGKLLLEEEEANGNY
jgi:hypothetical protein